MKSLKKVLSSLCLSIDSDSVMFSGNFDSTEGKYVFALQKIVEDTLGSLNLNIGIFDTNGDNRIAGNNKVWFTFSQNSEQYYLEEDEAEEIMKNIGEKLTS